MNTTSRESFATVARVIRREDTHTLKYVSVLAVAAQGILPVGVQLSRNVFAIAVFVCHSGFGYITLATIILADKSYE